MEAFDRLFERGRMAVLSGEVLTDKVPEPGDGRWGVSIILRPAEPLATQLQEVTDEALSLTGQQHWATGSRASAHLTLRSLEPHRIPVRPDEASVQRYAEAMRRAAATVGSVSIEVTGLTLTPRSVMARVVPRDPLLDALSAALTEALGPDGWYETEAGVVRDAWYMNLVHFTGAVQQPEELVAWVAARRDRRIGCATFTDVHLITWSFDGEKMTPSLITSTPLS